MFDKQKLKARMWLSVRKSKIFLGCGIVFLTLSLVSIYKINLWFETHKLVFEAPVNIHFQTPVYISLRELITIVKANDYTPNSPLTPNQQYACDKFGKDCRLALAIAHAENGTGQCDRINWSNTNQSIDIGFFQINTLWVDKKLVAAADLFDCRKNIDAAYMIYHRNGDTFKMWSTFQNKAYLKYMW